MTEAVLQQMAFYATGSSSHEWHIRLLVAEVRRRNEEAGMREGATTLALERAGVAEKQRDAARAENARLRAAVEHVLADAESQHPGGWGPDVTMVAVLKAALMSAHADHCGRAHYEGDGVPCRCDTE